MARGASAIKKTVEGKASESSQFAWIKPGTSLSFDGAVYKAIGYPVLDDNQQWNVDLLHPAALSKVQADCSKCFLAMDKLDTFVDVVLQIPKSTYMEGTELSFRLPGLDESTTNPITVQLPKQNQTTSEDHYLVVVRVSGEVINLAFQQKPAKVTSPAKAVVEPQTETHEQLVIKVTEIVKNLAPELVKTVMLDPEKPMGASVDTPTAMGLPRNQVPHLYYITKTEPGSQCEQAGVKAHDCIYQFDGVVVTEKCDLKAEYFKARQTAIDEKRMMTFTIIAGKEGTDLSLDV